MVSSMSMNAIATAPSSSRGAAVPRGREPGQGPGGDRIELADVAEGERAQERAVRRGRPTRRAPYL
jgi:hypothetical protein